MKLNIKLNQSIVTKAMDYCAQNVGYLTNVAKLKMRHAGYMIKTNLSPDRYDIQQQLLIDDKNDDEITLDDVIQDVREMKSHIKSSVPKFSISQYLNSDLLRIIDLDTLMKDNILIVLDTPSSIHRAKAMIGYNYGHMNTAVEKLTNGKWVTILINGFTSQEIKERYNIYDTKELYNLLFSVA